MTNATCPIWGTQAFEHPTGRDGRVMDSPRAGGKYFVSGRAITVLKTCKDVVKVRLTTWLVGQRRLGIEWPEIDARTISEAQHARDLRISERADGILRCLDASSNFLGREIDYRIPNNQTEIGTVGHPELNYYELLAHSGCLSDRDLFFLLNYLSERGLIEKLGVGWAGDGQVVDGCMLTVPGYERLASLDEANVESSKAFVAMWFDDSMNDAWERGFKKAIYEAGYEPIRIDQKEHVNKIDDEIIAEIRRARFVVADFTHGDKGARGGVYYEAGFAHGQKIPVIFTCRADVFEELHFDTRQFNHIRWKEPEELKEKLTNRIAAVIGDGPLLN